MRSRTTGSRMGRSVARISKARKTWKELDDVSSVAHSIILILCWMALLVVQKLRCRKAVELAGAVTLSGSLESCILALGRDQACEVAYCTYSGGGGDAKLLTWCSFFYAYRKLSFRGFFGCASLHLSSFTLAYFQGLSPTWRCRTICLLRLTVN